MSENRPVVLFAHERAGIGRAAAHVLQLHGIELEIATEYQQARDLLAARRFAAAVIDVALPGGPSYEMIGEAKQLAADGDGAGSDYVILVASVYRKTSYKRRPARLYGADDYVELHHLGDMLPDKLRRQLSLPRLASARELGAAEDRVAEALKVEGDSRMSEHDIDALAKLIVSDVVLYNGDRIAASTTLAEAQEAVAEDLEVARALLDQVHRDSDDAAKPGDPISGAFESLMAAMGRVGKGTDG